MNGMPKRNLFIPTIKHQTMQNFIKKSFQKLENNVKKKGELTSVVASLGNGRFFDGEENL